MTTVDHGFNMAAVRKALDAEDWEPDHNNPGTEIRRVFLGTIFGLTPSGKFYTPFACSNVAGCDSCKGTGVVPRHRRARVAKRWAKRAARIRATFDKRVRVNEVSAHAWLKTHQQWKLAHGTSCTACGGLGSREAYLDELWSEACERAFDKVGMTFSQDGEDYFAEEYRDAPEGSENEAAEEA